MKKKTWAFTLLLCGLLLAAPLSGCTSPAGSGASSGTSVSVEASAAITLSGETAKVSGSGAEAEGGVVTITKGGVYTVSGTLSEGRILINAPGEDVTLSLENASVTCSYGSPVYVYKAGSVTIGLKEGTENVLTDGGTYTFDDSLSSSADEEPNACLYSKADLTISGTGSLTVNGSYKNGITCKDALEIRSAHVTVTAVNHGVTGKDSCTVTDAVLTITAGGDALRSTNDSDGSLGFVTVTDSTLNLTSGEDGIQAETVLTMSGGSCTVLSGGGSCGTLADDASAKGLKAGTSVVISSGEYALNCCDDAVHSNGTVTITGGTFAISTGDDGVHADETVDISAGTIVISQCYEGIEGAVVNISGGDIDVTSSDDGINAADGSSSGFGNFGGFGGMTPPQNNGQSGDQGEPPALPDGTDASGDMPEPPEWSGGSMPEPPQGDDGSVPELPQGQDGSMPDMPEGGFDFGGMTGFSSCSINISGGTIRINASGDGLDSNGDLTVSGGVIYVSGPTSDGDSALDYDGTATITGGVVIAAGYSGMAQNFGSDSTQGSILLTNSAASTETISVTDSAGNLLAEYTPDKAYTCVVVSCPEMAVGESYTINAWGTSQTVTLDSLIYGSSGMGGMGGFGGGMGGKNPFGGNSGGQPPEKPSGSGQPQGGPSGNGDSEA